MQLRPSHTAMVTSLMRAVHSRLDPCPLLDDPWGDRLIPEPVRDALRQRIMADMSPDARAVALRSPDSVVDDFLRANVAYPSVIIRSRYTEDALKQAASRGTRQYVVIGAGFDSFFLRRPAFAQGLEIFEIDHPATQALKLQRVEECGISLPGPVHFLAADLADEDLASVLARSSFRKDEPAFFSWLGVTSYLTREANLRTLSAIATCGACESELVFTYVDQIEFTSASSSDRLRELMAAVASIGEPHISGFDPKEIESDLRQAGLELVEDLDGTEMSERYGGIDALRARGTTHIARARVRPADDAGP
jgi:methyltransferase (TIGR00027 family)